MKTGVFQDYVLCSTSLISVSVISFSQLQLCLEGKDVAPSGPSRYGLKSPQPELAIYVPGGKIQRLTPSVTPTVLSLGLDKITGTLPTYLEKVTHPLLFFSCTTVHICCSIYLTPDCIAISFREGPVFATTSIVLQLR